ncbi:MAG: exo-alpha-sialidase [Candidatus Latescibacteria bacterium]|nr:exo-alpha-sialidase [Candidatus Latescibacterota bacterium]
MKVSVKVVKGGESAARPAECRSVLVGPDHNQPEPFPGYAGFVGWESPVQLRDGSWLVGFNAGYWHASLPTPLRQPPGEREEWMCLGMPQVDAPTGGRCMLIRSWDQGRTWSRPQTLIDTPADDRHPFFLDLPGGPLLCGFFTLDATGAPRYNPEAGARLVFTRSFDSGHTWEEPRRLPSPFLAEEANGPLLLGQDGAVYAAANGTPPGDSPDQVGLFRTQDQGQSWQCLSTIRADHHLWEPSVAQLPDGRMVLMARPEGDICWSSDSGHTWTAPVSFGMRLFAPNLYTLRDGTLLCLHGSYAPGHGGLRVLFSRDGGQTWIAPAPDHGFLVDHTYGYGKAMELPDGSLFLTYLSTGGHRSEDARGNGIWCIRLRVRPDHSGIDLLPAPDLKR